MERLTVPGTLESLEVVADYVAEAATAAGLDEEASYRLRLAVDEIVTNVVLHGYGETGNTGMLELQAGIEDQSLTIWIEDTGLTYNPQRYKRPEGLDLPIDQRQIGGLGVYLAMRSVDEFLYEHVGDRNRHTLVVNRRA
jgi:anti-sigma regulatory factor (Ser/Thr protein kinase)